MFTFANIFIFEFLTILLESPKSVSLTAGFTLKLQHFESSNGSVNRIVRLTIHTANGIPEV